mgnify:CR=1 FL=1
MFRKRLKAGELDDTMIEIEVMDAGPQMPMMGNMPGMEAQMNKTHAVYDD